MLGRLRGKIKNNMNKTFKRKGFTLIELLIVIVVIGVLASMMILSSVEAAASAKATEIISNLTHLKMATITWYRDNSDRIVSSGTDNYHIRDSTGDRKLHELLSEKNSEIKKYIDDNKNISLNAGTKGGATDWHAAVGGYSVYMGNSNTRCYVIYRISENNNEKEERRLKEKLIAKAEQSHLLAYKKTMTVEENPVIYDGYNYVAMEAFRLYK